MGDKNDGSQISQMEEITLETLSRTKLGPMFLEAMAEVEESFSRDADISGIDLEPRDKYGGKTTAAIEFYVKVKTPSRVVKNLGLISGGRLKVDTVSGDARQPDMIGDVAESGHHEADKVGEKRG